MRFAPENSREGSHSFIAFSAGPRWVACNLPASLSLKGREPEWSNPQIEDGKLLEMPKNLVKLYLHTIKESYEISKDLHHQLHLRLLPGWYNNLVFHHYGSQPLNNYTTEKFYEVQFFALLFAVMPACT